MLRFVDRSPQGGAPMLPSELNDHAQLITREKAEFFGRLYSRMFRTDTFACSVQTPKGDHMAT